MISISLFVARPYGTPRLKKLWNYISFTSIRRTTVTPSNFRSDKERGSAQKKKIRMVGLMLRRQSARIDILDEMRAYKSKP